jgi:hypothetical protein
MLLALLALLNAPHTFTVTLEAGKLDRRSEVVRIPVLAPAGQTFHATLTGPGGKLFKGPVALLSPGLLSRDEKPPEGLQRLEVWMILDRLDAGASATFELTLHEGDALAAGPLLGWKKEPGSMTLSRTRGKEQTPLIRYEMPRLDESSPKAREETYKPFHHVYGPDGVLLSKGPGGKYTHHRGLFYGFMKASFGKEAVDVWHCKGQAHQAHRKVLDETRVNSVAGRHRVAIDWNAAPGKTFASEERELTAVPLPEGMLIDFASRLTTKGGAVTLDGDPQHAGFHFRASNEVAEKTEKETYFVRPSGVGKKGVEVNWPKEPKHANLPWLAMSFVVGGQRYTVAYLDHPSNPREARYSERAYGRFGSYFVKTVKPDEPLTVRYRVWVTRGEMQPEEVASLSAAFVNPVKVTVKAK